MLEGTLEHSDSLLRNWGPEKSNDIRPCSGRVWSRYWFSIFQGFFLHYSSKFSISLGEGKLIFPPKMFLKDTGILCPFKYWLYYSFPVHLLIHFQVITYKEMC